MDNDLTPQPRLTFHKGERLSHRTLVEALYREGNSIYDFPLRLSWRALSANELEESFRDRVPAPMDCVQMMVTVPKRKRRRAVDRVLMRRRIREAYRLNRLPFKRLVDEAPEIRTLCLGFVYIHDSNLPYSTIESKMRTLLKKLSGKLSLRET